MKIFRKRCKPQNSNKDNYTLEERQRILDYLADKTDIYSLAIRFSFFVPLRISETCAIKLKSQKILQICGLQTFTNNFDPKFYFVEKKRENIEFISVFSTLLILLVAGLERKSHRKMLKERGFWRA